MALIVAFYYQIICRDIHLIYGLPRGPTHSNPPDTTGDHSFMPSHAPAPRNRSINQNDAQIGKRMLCLLPLTTTILSIDLRNGAGRNRSG